MKLDTNLEVLLETIVVGRKPFPVPVLKSLQDECNQLVKLGFIERTQVRPGYISTAEGRAYVQNAY